MKANKELVKAITKLDLAVDLVKDALQEQIYDREEFYNDKTEKWQDGENGYAYGDETETMNCILSELENNMETVFDELREFDNLKI